MPLISLPQVAPPDDDPNSSTTLPYISRLTSYLTPIYLMLYGLQFIPEALFTQRANAQTSFAEHFFTTVWRRLQPLEDAEFAPEKARTVAGARGVVLEVGPGLGPWMGHYDRAAVTHVFGVEPNVALHGELRRRAAAHGWGGRYTVVGAGVEDVAALERAGLRAGAVDTVVSVQTLCTVPRPHETFPALYRWLAPGGELRCFEHVRSRDPPTAALQRLYDCVWWFVYGGCCLSRPIERWLVNEDGMMGWADGEGWEEATIERVKGEAKWSTLPVFSGMFRK